MPACTAIRGKRSKICAGDLFEPIDIFSRALTPPLNVFSDEFKATEDFTLVASVRAMIQTPSGETVFDEIGVERDVSTIFNIRFLAGLTSENWIVFESNRYDILKIINFQKFSLFLSVFCALAGDQAKEAAKT